MQNKIFLRDGYDWKEHDGYLVGNRDGLQELQDVIGSAIRFGEKKQDIDEFLGEDWDYIGVRCLPDEFFYNHENPKSDSSIVKGASDNKGATVSAVSLLIKFFLVALIFFIPFVVGIQTLFKNFMSSL